MMSQRVHIANIDIDSFRGLQGVKLGDLKPINVIRSEQLWKIHDSGSRSSIQPSLDLSEWLEVIRSRDPGRNRQGPLDFLPLVFSDGGDTRSSAAR